MTLLPIVDRELRVAARKRSTFWLRLVAALVALVIGTGVLVLSLAFGRGATQLGGGLFSTLTWLSLAVALGAGLFFTSDSLSEEKREGTLGLLFLTDLRGYDVVLGKLLATSLRGGYALLAVFPVLAVTFLLGGVTGGQFWRTVLAIVNALFFSLALGLFVSTLSRDSQRALAGTLGLLVLFLAAGPLADAGIAEARGRAFAPLWSLASPSFAFVQAGSSRGPFWSALGVNQLCAWLLLAWASWRVPRAWQDEPAQLSPNRLRWEHWWKYGGAKRRARLRTRLLDVNPALWLAARERWQALALWLLAGAVMVAFGTVFLLVSDTIKEIWVAFATVGSLLVLVLYLWTTAQACRFFADARRSGLLELLLASPLDSRRLAEGAWRALARSFGPPVIVLLVVEFVTQSFSQSVTLGAVSATAGIPTFSAAVLVAGSGVTCLATLANLVALVWFGLWMGLTTKSANLATIKALLFVQIIPAFAFSFVSGLLLVSLLTIPAVRAATTGATPTFVTWVPMLLPAITAVLAIVKDMVFIRWSRNKLFGDFRELALQTSSRMRLPAAPPVIPAPAQP